MKALQRLDQDPGINRLNKLSNLLNCQVQVIQYEGKSYPAIKNTDVSKLEEIVNSWDLQIKVINKNGSTHIALVGKDSV